MDDYEQIRHLSATYNRTSDFVDAEGWASCWTDDGYMKRSNVPFAIQGRAALLEAGRTTPVRGIHMMSDYVIAVDGATATASGNVNYLDRDNNYQTHFFGIYRDELVKTPDGWKYRVRVLDVLNPDGSVALPD